MKYIAEDLDRAILRKEFDTKEEAQEYLKEMRGADLITMQLTKEKIDLLDTAVFVMIRNENGDIEKYKELQKELAEYLK